METQLMAKKKKGIEDGYSVPGQLFDKEFLKRFHGQEDVDKFMNDLHAHLYEQLLQAEKDEHLGYEKNDPSGNNSGNSRNGAYSKTIQTLHGESDIKVPRDRNGNFETVIIPKHANKGMSLEKLVISLYAKGISRSDIEDELRDIYQINLSSSSISIITNKVTQAALEWQNRPLEKQYLIVWMDGIVFKVRDGGNVINNTV